MHLTLEVLRANQGDCLTLHYGTADSPRLMLIDGGPPGVYRDVLKDRLIAIRDARQRAGQIEDGAPLKIDLVVVSHVDDDHIQGMIELAQEQQNQNPDLPVVVSSLWHNSFDDLLATDEVPHDVTASVLAGVSESQFDQLDAETTDESELLHLLASVSQGRNLRKIAGSLGWMPNDLFGGELILVSQNGKPVSVDGLTVTVAGPMQPELLKLQKDHDAWLREQIKKGKLTASAVLAAYVDKSVPNLSSIVLLVECEKKSILLTGDARGDKILEGLELAGRLKPSRQPPDTIHVDILKVPHHGSDNNMETGFFQRVTADHYVFSGDGQYGNPERATLQMLLDARGVEKAYTIHLTYPIDVIDAAREKEWIKQRNSNIKKGKPPGPEWSPAEHSLGVFFSTNPKMLDKVVILATDEPHLINLLDPVTL
jgi:hypothetical protein